MQIAIYFIFLISIRLFSIIPFKVLYFISDFLKFLFYYLIKYRRKVIINNLKNSFPEKVEEEIFQLLKKVYKNLLDIIVESIKGLTMSHQEVVKRHKILNPEVINQFFDRGESVICVSAHYCNWEWGAVSGGLQLKHKVIALYKPLSNKYIDQYMRDKRAKALTTMASIYETTKTFEENTDKTCAFIMVADQSPTDINSAYWIQFFNRETACLHGPEKHSRNNNLPIIYLDVQREKRGYYTIELSLLIDDPNKYKESEITAKYMSKLEDVIKKEPQNWLWSHRRWKKQKPVS